MQRYRNQQEKEISSIMRFVLWKENVMIFLSLHCHRCLKLLFFWMIAHYSNRNALLWTVTGVTLMLLATLKRFTTCIYCVKVSRTVLLWYGVFGKMWILTATVAIKLSFFNIFVNQTIPRFCIACGRRSTTAAEWESHSQSPGHIHQVARHVALLYQPQREQFTLVNARNQMRWKITTERLLTYNRVQTSLIWMFADNELPGAVVLLIRSFLI